MRIAVIDGQGGGIGRAIVERLRRELPEGTEILALGTNAMATSVMLRAGADDGASGENAIVVNASKVNIICGVVGIIAANSMFGELTPAMARAVAESPAPKVLLPLNRCGLELVGVEADVPMPRLIEKLALSVKEKFEVND